MVIMLHILTQRKKISMMTILGLTCIISFNKNIIFVMGQINLRQLL